MSMSSLRVSNALILVSGFAAFVPVLIVHKAGHLSEAGAVGSVLGIVVVGLTLIMIFDSRRVRAARAEWVASRAPLPDDEFLQQLGAIGDYARFCLIVRDGLAIDCWVPPATIHLDDAIRDLEHLCFDGFYLHEIIFALEKELPAHVADIRQLKIFQRWTTITLRELLEGAAAELKIDGPSPLAASH
jgi:hypothetical protein